MIVSGKGKRVRGRRVMSPSWRKAIVTLKPGEKIEIFEGV
jgi:ribosomal protein L23